jgi:aminoglycoside phosphotransferase (APT) family kinase protein
VHSEFNGKNLLVLGRGGRWSISAVLDWEFAFSGSPLVDVGNMLRFRASYPPSFVSGFIAGFRRLAESYRRTGGRSAKLWTCMLLPTS